MQLPDLNKARKRTKEEVKIDHFKLPEKYKELGKNKTYYVKTYGCQMNEHDSENICGLLDSCGFTKNDDMEEAVNILSEYAKKENQIKTGKLEELFKKFEGNYTTNATSENRELFKKYFPEIKDKLRKISLMEILNQEKFFEKLIEIILLKCLNSECIMENTENSKDFIKQFKID